MMEFNKLTVTERDKKLLVVLGLILFLVLNYLLIFKFLTIKIGELEQERDKLDTMVASAKADLENEADIIKEYENVLAQTNDKASGFFPQIYPYKDRYLLLMDQVIRATGAEALRLDFEYPEVGAVPLPESETAGLPGYPLQDLALKINKLAKQKEDKPAVDKKPAAKPPAKPANNQAKTLPADAVVRMPFVLEFQGSYAQAREVIRKVENLQRALAIEGVAMEKVKDSSLVKVNLSLALYAVEKVDNSADPFNDWSLQGTYGKADPFNP